jgi:hypothetical protein
VLIGLSHPQSVWVVGAYDAKQGWLEDKRAFSYFKRAMAFSVFSETGPAGFVTLGKVEDGDVLGGYFAPARQKAAAAPAVALFERLARPCAAR